MPVRKQLAETLILSKIDYCDVVGSLLPEYQLKRSQRVQNAFAVFVIGKYAKVDEVSNLRCLRIHERSEFNILHVVYIFM